MSKFNVMKWERAEQKRKAERLQEHMRRSYPTRGGILVEDEESWAVTRMALPQRSEPPAHGAKGNWKWNIFKSVGEILGRGGALPGWFSALPDVSAHGSEVQSPKPSLPITVPTSSNDKSKNNLLRTSSQNAIFLKGRGDGGSPTEKTQSAQKQGKSQDLSHSKRESGVDNRLEITQSELNSMDTLTAHSEDVYSHALIDKRAIREQTDTVREIYPVHLSISEYVKWLLNRWRGYLAHHPFILAEQDDPVVKDKFDNPIRYQKYEVLEDALDGSTPWIRLIFPKNCPPDLIDAFISYRTSTSKSRIESQEHYKQSRFEDNTLTESLKEKQQKSKIPSSRGRLLKKWGGPGGIYLSSQHNAGKKIPNAPKQQNLDAEQKTDGTSKRNQQLRNELKQAADRVAKMKNGMAKDKWQENPGRDKAFQFDRQDKFVGKVMRIIVTHKDGTSKSYDITTDKNNCFEAAKDMAEKVNRRVPDIQMGEKVTDNKIMPLGSMYRNKFWVKFDSGLSVKYEIIHSSTVSRDLINSDEKSITEESNGVDNLQGTTRSELSSTNASTVTSEYVYPRALVEWAIHEPVNIVQKIYPVHISPSEFQKWLQENGWGRYLGKVPKICVEQDDPVLKDKFGNPIRYQKNVTLVEALDSSNPRMRLIYSKNQPPDLIDPIIFFRTSTPESRAESREKYGQSCTENNTLLERLSIVEERLQNSTATRSRNNLLKWVSTQSWSNNFTALRNPLALDVRSFQRDFDSPALEGKDFDYIKIPLTPSQKITKHHFRKTAQTLSNNFIKKLQKDLFNFDKANVSPDCHTKMSDACRFFDALIETFSHTALNAEFVLNDDLMTRLSSMKMSTDLNTPVVATVKVSSPISLLFNSASQLASGGDDVIHTLSFNSTYSELGRGSWRPRALEKIGLGYQWLTPVSHLTPRLTKVDLPNGTALSGDQLQILSADADVYQASMRASAFIDIEPFRQALERAETRRHEIACFKFIGDILHGKIESFPTDPGFENTLEILRNLIAGRKQTTYPLTAKSRAGKLPVKNLLVVELTKDKKVLLADGEYTIVTDKEWDRLGSGTILEEPIGKLRALLIPRIDLKQRVEASVRKPDAFLSLLAGYRTAVNADPFITLSLKDFINTVEGSKLADKAIEALKRLREEHENVLTKAGLQGGLLFMKSPETILEIANIYANQYPDECFDVKLSIIKEDSVKKTLAEISREQVAYQKIWLKRDLDIKQYNAAMLSSQQLNETLYFCLNLVLSAGVGGAAGYAASALQLSARATWFVSIGADMLSGMAINYADFVQETNEAEREGKRMAILYGALLSMGIGLGGAGFDNLRSFARNMGIILSKEPDIARQLNKILSERIPNVVDRVKIWSILDNSRRTEMIVNDVMGADSTRAFLQSAEKPKSRAKLEEQTRIGIERLRAAREVTSYLDEFEAGYAAIHSDKGLEAGLRFGAKEEAELNREISEEYKSLKERYMKNSDFLKGRADFLTIDIPGFEPQEPLPSVIKLRKQFNEGSNYFTPLQRGAFSQRIDDAAKATTLKWVGDVLQKWKSLGAELIPLPQTFLLPIMGELQSGRCLPIVRAMIVALDRNSEQSFAANLFKAAADPDVFGKQMKMALRKLHVIPSEKLSEFSTTLRLHQDIFELSNLLNLEGSNGRGGKYFQINARNLSKDGHSMMVGSRGMGQEKRYFFFDPNFGLAQVDSQDALTKLLQWHFVKNGLGEHYGAFGTRQSPKFEVVEINPGSLATWNLDYPRDGGDTVAELSRVRPKRGGSPWLDTNLNWLNWLLSGE